MVKKLVSAAIIGLSMSATAMAADLYAPAASREAPAEVHVQPGTWTGLYFGANVGYGWNAGQHDIVTTNIANSKFLQSQGFASSGGFGGGQIGYNFQRDRVVLGIEADIQGSGISDHFRKTIIASGGNPFDVDAKQQLGYFGTVRGRLGFVADRAMIFATAGLAYGQVKNQHTQTGADANCAGCLVPLNDETTKVGYTIGGGVEYALDRAWSVKAEYQYINLGSETVQAPFLFPGGVSGPVVTNKIDSDFHTVRLGVNYKLHREDASIPLK